MAQLTYPVLHEGDGDEGEDDGEPPGHQHQLIRADRQTEKWKTILWFAIFSRKLGGLERDGTLVDTYADSRFFFKSSNFNPR